MHNIDNTIIVIVMIFQYCPSLIYIYIYMYNVYVYIYKEFCVGGSKAKTVLDCSYSRARCESFIEPDTRMVKNRKAFKRFFSALSALDKTEQC